ncbi:MAG: czcD 1 [Gammaproteobacteria bacterium]|jgi:cobalt-zinc-cadmium efflux system protein|nr:czcD 1 [Gammaproteobacteria bacterium]
MAHSHSHDHHNIDSAYSKINLSFAIAVGANLLYTFIEGGYAIYADSMGLLADAGHNLGDVLGLLLAWGASWLMVQPAKDRYSYGYKRSSVLASLLNAFLLVAASAIIAYESIVKLIHPSAVGEITVIIVAAIGIVINASSAMLFAKSNKHDLNIKGAFLHLLADALLSFGVLVTGIVVYYTGWDRLDPLIGLVIIIVILAGTWDLLRQSLRLLLDAAPKHIETEKVSAFLKALPGVETIHDLHIWGLSTREVALTAHLVMPKGGFSDAEFHDINHELLDEFSIHHVTLQIEKGNDGPPCSQAGTC